MSDRLSIDQLCAKYDNENVHTEHVTRLALSLFDHTRAWLGLPASERPLLEAAGRLHDVGYKVDPVHHVEISTEILLGEGLRGFRDEQCPVIAGIILFHSGKIHATLHHPIMVQLSTEDIERVKRLGAFLRIADGLDSGHIQDTTIVEVKRMTKKISVLADCKHFPYNLVRADRKADLFRAVFPYDIEFTQAPKRRRQFTLLIDAETHGIEAARRLLSLQYKKFLANVDGATEAASSEPLHDIRVAIRRQRAILNAFRKHLPKTQRKKIDAALKKMGRDLGPARDADVWMDFLQSAEVQHALSANRQWPFFLQHQRQQRILHLATVRRCLRGPAMSAFRTRMGYFLRTELPRLTQGKPLFSLEKLAAKQLRKALRRAMKLEHLRHSNSPEKLHMLRVELRKARYLGEFFAPALGGPIAKLTKRLHQTEQALGAIHDMDVGLERIQHEGPVPPRLLTTYMKERRNLSLANLEKSWRRLTDPALQRDVRRHLAQAAGRRH